LVELPRHFDLTFKKAKGVKVWHIAPSCLFDLPVLGEGVYKFSSAFVKLTSAWWHPGWLMIPFPLLRDSATPRFNRRFLI
jgi:hypothetical protein